MSNNLRPHFRARLGRVVSDAGPEILTKVDSRSVAGLLGRDRHERRNHTIAAGRDAVREHGLEPLRVLRILRRRAEHPSPATSASDESCQHDWNHERPGPAHRTSSCVGALDLMRLHGRALVRLVHARPTPRGEQQNALRMAPPIPASIAALT